MASQLDKIRKKMQSGEITKPKDPHQKTAGGFDESVINPEYSESIPEKLEDIELQITKLQNKVTECGWLIGKRLSSVEVNHLDGTPYQNIAEYAEAKFGFKRTTTYNLIFVSRHFTKIQSIEFGSKLYLLSSLEESKRQKYLNWMMENKPSRREIENKIKTEQKRPGRPKQDISLGKFKLSVDLKKMGVQIKKEEYNEFLRQLTDLILKFGESNNTNVQEEDIN